MKTFRENWPWFRRRLMLLVVGIYLVFGLHGLFTYYIPRIEKPWQLVSAVFYGMMSMFLFNSPLSAEADVTWTYEVAKWLAPILTSALLVRTLIFGFRHAFNAFRNRFGKHVVVFGLTPASTALLNNLRTAGEGYRTSLVTAQKLEEGERNRLEQGGTAVYRADFVNDVRMENESSAQAVRLSQAAALVLAEENDLANYNLFMALLPVLRPGRRLHVHLRIHSAELMGYLNEALTAAQARTPDLRHVDLHFYSQDSMAVSLLLREGNLLEENLRRLAEYRRTSLAPTVREIGEAMGRPSLVLFGWNGVSEQLMLRAANDLTLGLEQKTAVTLVAADATARLEGLLATNPMLDAALELTARDVAAGSKGFNALLAELRQARERPTCVALLHEDALVNLAILARLDEQLPGVPVLFRNVSGADLRPLVAGAGRRITLFGNLKEVMTPALVLQEKLDEAAIAFNARYNRTAEAAGSGGGKEWEELPPVRKRSSRESAAHARVKEAVLLALLPEGSPAELAQRSLGEAAGRLRELQEGSKGETFREGLLQLLEENPALDYLTRLEHQRWCNAYYAMGFRHGEVKDEQKRTHPCLIEDWEIIRGEAFFTCHPEYDLISVLALFGGETNAAAKGAGA